MAALNGPTDVVFAAAPAGAMYLQSCSDSDVFASAAIPANRLTAIDAGSLVAAHGTEPRFAASRDSTLYEDDVAGPLSAVGSPNTVAAPLRSLYQTDIIAIRSLLFVAWAVARAVFRLRIRGLVIAIGNTETNALAEIRRQALDKHALLETLHDGWPSCWRGQSQRCTISVLC